MSKYFDNALEWTDENKDTLGLPRPFKKIGDEFRDRVKYHIAKIVPIPWQSIPVFLELGLLLNKKNESLVFLENRCAYCGIQFIENEQCVRWIIPKEVKREGNSLVNSDSFPFHLVCMKQARIFCPFMRKTKNEEFETGTFIELKEKCLKELDSENIKRGG